MKDKLRKKWCMTVRTNALDAYVNELQLKIGLKSCEFYRNTPSGKKSRVKDQSYIKIFQIENAVSRLEKLNIFQL